MTPACEIAVDVTTRLLERNALFEEFFDRRAHSLADACREMAMRFLKGGRLLAFGRGPHTTDAQHVSVEFVHPIIVGKRALPALDISLAFRPWLQAILRPEDVVMGFGPPDGDPEVADALAEACRRGAMTFELPGRGGSWSFEPPSQNPFILQELVEILYHTLWETVHVFLEHREMGYDVGDSGFLYPYLGSSAGKQNEQMPEVTNEVAESIRAKARDDAGLRARLAHEQSEQIAAAARAIHQQVQRGGKLIIFGNGGSATDANDFALDCVLPPRGFRPVPAISLSLEPANLTAIANDVGIDLIFLRQLIAQARPEDIAVGISTSGGSRNIIMALEEARKRGMLTVALLGYDGGEILRRRIADFALVVRSDYIPRIQEVQASTYHMIRESLEVLAHAGI
jgi:D-sedoheptulose 7-phosphate isomerase